jgi:hypothetical protein
MDTRSQSPSLHVLYQHTNRQQLQRSSVQQKRKKEEIETKLYQFQLKREHKKRQKTSCGYAAYGKVTLNLTLLPSLREIGECHVILNGVWQWLKHESMNSPQPHLS